MRYCLFLLIVAAIVLLPTGCEQTDARQKPQTDTKSATARQSPADDKPLLLEDEPLLLLDDPPRADEPNGPIADNSRCFVCHINYMQEDIAVAHARRHIGCAHCHGESDEHIADESWASGGGGTAPDKMYTRQMINPFCLTCHSKEKLSEEPHKILFADSGDKKYCTDCHGDHRLKDRKCKWK